jgi:hypothetical protein
VILLGYLGFEDSDGNSGRVAGGYADKTTLLHGIKLLV